MSDLKNTASSLAVQGPFFGVYTALVLVSMAVMLNRSPKSRKHRLLLAIIVFMYLNSAGQLGLAIDRFMTATGNKPPDTHDIITKVVLSFLLFNVNLLISDVIVLWRAHVLWGRNVLLMGVSLVLLLACLISMPLNCVYIVRLGNSLTVFKASHNVYASIACFSSVLINIWATSLVGLKTYIYRNEVSRYLRSYGESPVGKLLILFTESGILYTLIWSSVLATYITGFSITDEGSGTAKYINTIYPAMNHIVGIYPAAVILCVCMQRNGMEGSRVMFSVRVTRPSSSTLENSAQVTLAGTGPDRQFRGWIPRQLLPACGRLSHFVK